MNSKGFCKIEISSFYRSLQSADAVGKRFGLTHGLTFSILEYRLSYSNEGIKNMSLSFEVLLNQM